MTKLEELNAQLKYVMAEKKEVPVQEFAEMTLLLLNIILERLDMTERAVEILLEEKKAARESDAGHVDTTVPGK